MGNSLSTHEPSLSYKEIKYDYYDKCHLKKVDNKWRIIFNNIDEISNQSDHKVDSSKDMETNISVQSSFEPQMDNNLLDTLCNLPYELKQLEECARITEELNDKRQNIISKLREIADYLENTHADVLIADRVGTGVSITSGLLTIGGLVAAPFTAGISLGLTIAGIGSGLAGGITSAGANLTGYFLLKNALNMLKTELKEHNLKIEKLKDLINDSSYLRKAIRLRPTLCQLGPIILLPLIIFSYILDQLSRKGFVELMSLLQTLISLALKGNYAQINKIVDHHVDPSVKHILRYFDFVDLNPETLHALAQLLTQILNQIDIIVNAIKSFVYHLARPELAATAMMLTSLSTTTARTTKTIANDAVEVSAAFKGTPLAMSKTARYMTGALTAAFIVVDIIHMTHICQETGNTPTVQELRQMANMLENDFQLYLSDQRFID